MRSQTTHRRMAPPLLLALVALAAPAATAGLSARALEGRWQGAIEIPGSPLGVEVELSRAADASWSGTISIPLQNARDLPLTRVEVAGDSVSFAIAGVPGEPTFAGTVAEGATTIRGDFTQGGQTYPFALTRAVPAADRTAAALAAFDELVARGMRELEVPGAAVGIVVDGEVVLARGYGVRELGRDAPVTERTLFAIGSATKAFTTFLMGQLVEKGALSWDRPVATYLPGFRLHDRIATELITPRDLVTHRSGLPRHDLLWYNANLSRQEMVERLRHLEANHTLREKFQYNNAMFLTAGYLVEQLTGESWEDNVRQRIFEPLGMARSNFSVLDSQASDDFAHPHSERDKHLQPIPFRVITNVGPAGSINSSVEEMTAWLQAQLGFGRAGSEPLLGAPTLADMHAPHMPTGATLERPELSQASYGLGWFVDTYRGHSRVHHGGGIDGFITMVTLLPQDRIGIVAFANRDGTGLPELLVRHAADLLLGLEPIDWIGEAAARRTQARALQEEAEARRETVRKAGTTPSRPLAEYAGSYRHPGYGELVVTLRAGRLEMTYNDITAPLEHWHYEVFNAAEGAPDPVFEHTKLLFQGDLDGEVAAVAIALEPQVADIVFRKEPDARLSDPAHLARFVGDYDLAGQTVSVGLQGSTLTVTIPGQPLYHLVPGLGGRFTLREYSIVGVSFEVDAAGEATALTLYQPSGVFTAERKR